MCKCFANTVTHICSTHVWVVNLSPNRSHTEVVMEPGNAETLVPENLMLTSYSCVFAFDVFQAIFERK
jgi:hypothetical protein